MVEHDVSLFSVTTETRATITAIIVYGPTGVMSVQCTRCHAMLVDDDRSPFYDALTDNGVPHVCP